jgi:hypothetical protein
MWNPDIPITFLGLTKLFSSPGFLECGDEAMRKQVKTEEPEKQGSENTKTDVRFQL